MSLLLMSSFYEFTGQPSPNLHKYSSTGYILITITVKNKLQNWKAAIITVAFSYFWDLGV